MRSSAVFARVLALRWNESARPVTLGVRSKLFADPVALVLGACPRTFESRSR
jgi:hypothetical protein